MINKLVNSVIVVAAVVFATRSGLAIHSPTIELLHLMGAPDSYIASLFQRHALSLGIRGSLLGAVVAAAALASIARLTKEIDTALLPPLTVGPMDLLILLSVPLAAVLLVMATARLTVLRSLARMA